jgi:hypothetical protein
VLHAVLVQIDEGHPRLDDSIVELVVDLDDLVHAVQVQRDGAIHAGRGAAVAEVLAAREGPEGDGVLVGDVQHALELVG